MDKAKPIIRMIVVEEEDGFSGFSTVGDTFIVAMGDTFDDLLENLVVAVNFSLEDKGVEYVLYEIHLVSSQSEDVSLEDAYNCYAVVEG